VLLKYSVATTERINDLNILGVQANDSGRTIICTPVELQEPRLGVNIGIIFISCKVCNFTSLNSARLTIMNFEKTKFILFGNRTNAASFCGKMPH